MEADFWTLTSATLLVDLGLFAFEYTVTIFIN